MYKMKKVGEENLLYLGNNKYMFQGVKYSKSEISLFLKMKQIPYSQVLDLLDFTKS